MLGNVMRFTEFASNDTIRTAAKSRARSIIATDGALEDAHPISPQDAQAAAIKRQQQQLRQRKQQLQMDKLRKRERELAAAMSSTAQPK
ncbi:MAG: hypothetical protein EB015_18575 [Methylocystaceae bacterium]|nr:hypothetical protein [Methylocystaceae bacterium]